MKRFFVILALAFLLTNNINASDFSAVCESGQTLYYNITSNTEPYTVEVVRDGNNQQTGDLIIPETVVYNNITYYVTSIYTAFSYCSELTSVVIPNTVTNIGNSAFYMCSGLTSVTFGNSVENIGTIAFEDCYNLRSITLPNSLTNIDYGAFQGCSGLTGTLTIPDSVTSIGRYAFGNCRGLTGTLIIPASVTFIGEGAFTGCSGLTGLTIYSSEEIGNYAFRDCTGLRSVVIGDLVTNIGYMAFSSCSALETLTIGNSVTEIEGGAFGYCSSLTSLTLGNSLTTIGDGAFHDCSGLAGLLIIPNSVSYIGERAFEKCSGLSSIVLPDGITNIGYQTFYHCSGLTSLIIPNSVTSIGTGAFCGCSRLTELVIPNSVTSIESEAFIDCTSLTTLVIGNSVTSIGQYAFERCRSLYSLTIGNSFTSIGSGAFSGCGDSLGELNYNATNCTVTNMFKNFTNLSTLNIGDNVTNIPAGTFYGCTGLTSVTIPNSVETIGENAFYMVKNIVYGGNATGSPWGALSLNGYVDGYLVYSDDTKTNLIGCGIMATDVNIPSSVVRIGNSAFINCRRLTTLTVPNSVMEIGENAFSGCSGLVEMTIPFVGKSASYTVESDTTLFGFIFGATEYSGGSRVNQNYTPNNHRTYYIPSGLQTINFEGDRLPFGAFSGCNMLTSVTLGEDVTNVGSYAFYNCSRLDNVNFDATNCMEMGNPTNPVFANCNNFTDLRIGEDVTNIPSYSFFNCKNLGSVSIPSSVLTIGDSAFYKVSNITYYGTATGRPWGALSINGYGEDGLFYTSTEKDTLMVALRTLVSAEVPNTVLCILPNAFNDCSLLESLSLGSAIRTIGNYAFSGCSSLTNVTLPDSLEVIGQYAFSGCSSLTNVILPDSLEEIGQYAFYNCSRINVLTIPNTVEVFGSSAFYGCSGLADIYMNCTTPPSASIFNFPTYYNAILWVPCGSLDAYGSWNDFEDIRESRAYMLRLSSAAPRFGTARLTQQPDCTDGIAIISATANEHYHFVQWNDGNTDNPRTIMVTEDTTFVAMFANDQYLVSVVSADETMGTVSEGGTYEYGAELLISAIANEHHHFLQWNDGNTDNPRTIVVEGDATYAASFAIDQHMITVLSADETLGYVVGGGTYDYGAEIQIYANASDGYAFLSWDDGNSDNPRAIVVDEDATYIATFAEARVVTIESSNSEMGTVIGSGVYAEGAVIEITAVPYEGYRFDHWVDLDNPSRDFNTDNPRTIVVSTDVTYMAVFTDVVGIEDIDVPEISVFPNPASDMLNITSTETISEIEIVNSLGQVVYRAEVNADNVVCDVNGLSNGVYLVRIQSKGAVVVQRRFVKE